MTRPANVFDKTGKTQSVSPYPAGPEIDRLAEQGNPNAFDFPRPMINDPGDDFSCLADIEKLPFAISSVITRRCWRIRNRCGICAPGVQAAIVDVLVKKKL